MRQTGQRIDLRAYRPGDEDSLLALHNQEFSGHPPRTMSHWRWKYRDNPPGTTDIVLARQGDDPLLGSYSGIPHALLLQGQECRGELHADVTVDGSIRNGLAGARLSARMMSRHFELFGGGDIRLTWGFPAPGLLRIGMRLCRSFVLRDVVFLLRDVADPFRETDPGIVVRQVDRFGAEVDGLWQECRDEIRTAIIRDAAYLNWRYADRPDLDHVLLEARRSGDGALRGVAVCREGGWHEELFSMLDWLAPRDDLDVEDALLSECLRTARSRERSWIGCWFAGEQARFHRFQTRHAFFAQQTPYQQCFRAFSPGLSRQALAEEWYQTMGDMDFF